MNRKPVYVRKPLTPDEFFRLFGQMFQGLSVPGSMSGLLGTAHEPWATLKGGLNLRGYPTAEECEKAAREVFEPYARLIEATKAAAEVWDSNSASLDPEEIHAMLVDAIIQAEKASREVFEPSMLERYEHEENQ